MDLVTPEWGFILLLVLVAFAIILPIVALISILSNKFQNNDKLIWALVVLLAPLIGSIIYFIIGKPLKTA